MATNRNLVILILLLIYEGGLFGQFTYLDKSFIKKRQVTSLKNLHNASGVVCDCTSSDSCAHTYTFVKGRLSEEVWFSSQKEKSANEGLKFVYEYSKKSADQLAVRNGNLEYGYAQQNYFIKYFYKNKKLKTKMSGYTYNHEGRSETDNSEVIKYYYSKNGKLESEVSYSISESKKKGMYDTIEMSRKYFLYEGKKLVGYFPSKDYQNDELSVSDSIYSKEKINELKAITFSVFSKKYFNNEVYKKIIDDCYTTIKSDQLLINNIPANTFLYPSGNEKTQHLILEIADNYFLFYKIVN